MSMNFPTRCLTALISIISLAIPLAACGSSGPLTTINVVSSVNTWGEIAAEIGGTAVHVTSLISDPNVDPHLFQSSVSTALSIAQANVIIENGLGYDSFMSRLVAANGSSTQTVLIASHLMGISGSAANPHLWYDLEKIGTVASAFTSTFIHLLPGKAAYFAANERAFMAALNTDLVSIRSLGAAANHAPIAYTERVAGYLLAEAGFTDLTPQGFALAIENGVAPSIQDTTAMESLITSHRIRALIYNSQTISPATASIRSLATAHHIPVIPVSETMPANITFPAWQLKTIAELHAALGG